MKPDREDLPDLVVAAMALTIIVLSISVVRRPDAEWWRLAGAALFSSVAIMVIRVVVRDTIVRWKQRP